MPRKATATEVKEAVKNTGVKAAETVKEAAGKAADKVAEKAAEVKEAAKAETKKAAAKAATAKNAVKTAAKKVAAKKTEPVSEVYVQYGGREATVESVIAKATELYVADGHRASSIKSLQIYLKPEEAAAYYVINKKYAGRVELF